VGRVLSLAALVLAAALVWAFFRPIVTFLAPPTVSKRYAVEVDLQVGQEILTGRAVWEILLWRQANSFPRESPAFRREVRGQAIAFEVAGMGTLFALKRPSVGGGDPSAGEYILECLDWKSADDLVQVLRDFRGGCEVERSLLVVRVVGGDGAVPTIERVDATNPGSNIRLVGLRVQVTDNPVTIGIARTYPWVLELPEPQRSNISKVIYRHDFTTEEWNWP
jgi:hypothetical protein